MHPEEFKNPEKRSAVASEVCDRLKGNVNDVSFKYTPDEKTKVSFGSSPNYPSSRNSTKTTEQKLNLAALGSRSVQPVTKLLATNMYGTSVMLRTQLSLKKP